jgi:hypothetical protein
MIPRNQPTASAYFMWWMKERLSNSGRCQSTAVNRLPELAVLATIYGWRERQMDCGPDSRRSSL